MTSFQSKVLKDHNDKVREVESFVSNLREMMLDSYNVHFECDRPSISENVDNRVVKKPGNRTIIHILIEHDRVLMNDYWKEMAAKLFEVPVDKVTDEQRKLAKKAGYLYMYERSVKC